LIRAGLMGLMRSEMWHTLPNLRQFLKDKGRLSELSCVVLCTTITDYQQFLQVNYKYGLLFHI